MILEPVVTDEMAEVGLCLEFRKPKSAEEVARSVANPKRRKSFYGIWPWQGLL